jgi:protein-S-isoprenylcysteine O-methyltransferase Ste14
MKADLHSKIAYLTIGLSVLIGGGSLVVFMAFLYTGSLNIVDLGMDAIGALRLDFSLCLFFFIQHSSMTRESFRRWIEGFIQPHYHGAFFAIFSGIALLLLVIFWQQSERTVVVFEGVARLFLHLTFIISIVGLLWSARSLRSFDIVGKNQILAHIHNRQLPAMPFAIRGPYRCIRHPIYFFMLLMIWSCPDVSLDRLLFNGLWSIWIVVGTVLEERDLAAGFGAVYRDYQRRVPMLIPWRICSKTFDKCCRR